MSLLELVGAAAIYIVCVILAGYAGALFTLFLNRRGGLEAFVLLPIVAITIWLVGAICGAVWLGVQIGQMP